MASNSLWIIYHSNCSINACLYGCHMRKNVRVSSTGTQTCAVCITTLTLTYKKRSEQRQKSFISLPCLRKDPPYSGLCSGTVQWPLAAYSCYWATRKSWLFHRNPMLGSLDFPGSEHLVPLNFFFLRAQPWHLWFGFLVLIWFGWEFFFLHTSGDTILFPQHTTL